MNWNKLSEEIFVAARLSFSELISRHNEEHFYAFALYTDSDCYTVVPAANSLQKYDTKIAEDNVDDETELVAYKWSIAEWAYEACGSNYFKGICDLLSTASNKAGNDEQFLQFKMNVHTCMINALQRLEHNGLFGTMRSNFVLYISMSDDDDALELENKSAKILNPSNLYNEFLARWS